MGQYVTAFQALVVLFALDRSASQYTNCSGDTNRIGDGFCDWEINNVGCAYDGGDCCNCTCVDGVSYACGVNDFNCSDPACPNEDASPPPNCTGTISWLGNGWCDPENNNLACGFDGGDCCACTCMDGIDYSCGSNGFDCEDDACANPAIPIEYPDCEGNWLSIGDGWCSPENNNDACGYDGGDCCLCTCRGSVCGISGFDCSDPAAGDEFYGCKPPPPTSLPCPADIQRVWVVGDTAQSNDLAEGVNCSGGSFEVLWNGEVVLDKTIYIFDGTVLNVTGVGSVASMDGNSTNRVLTVVNASVHLTGVNVSYGAGIVGGAIAAARSRLTLDRSAFFGNAATGHGGAIYATERSVVSVIGCASFSGNTAGNNGGAVFVFDSSFTGGNVTFSSNTAGGSGGAVMATDNASLVWSGNNIYFGNHAEGLGGAMCTQRGSATAWITAATFQSNSANSSAGALALQTGSSAFLLGETTFTNNRARYSAGAILVRDSSNISWNASTTFLTNRSGFEGGAIFVFNGSSVIADGRTLYEGNNGSGAGAMIISGNSTAACGGNTTIMGNKAKTHGGAVLVSDHSSAAWNGDTAFSANSAGDSGGAVFALSDSNISFSGRTAFHGNLAAMEGGIADEPGILWSGGGVAVLNSTLTLSGETIFADNQALDAGGAAYAFGATALITGRSSFINNSGGMVGGAVACLDSNFIVDGNTTFGTAFSANSAGDSGGAVFAMSDSNISFSGRTAFHGNLAAMEGGIADEPGMIWSGGGVAVLNSTLTLSGETIFADNQALDAGGAVYSGSATVFITGRSSFINNSGGRVGGAVVCIDSNFIVDGNTTFDTAFSANSARDNGGAVFAISYSNISFIGRNAFHGNLAASGGGVSVVNSTLTLSGETIFADNQALRDGGAVQTVSATALITGRSSFINNSGGTLGGAVDCLDSNFVVDGNTTFDGNIAETCGGGINVAINARVFWSGKASFVNNSADGSGGAGGAVCVLSNSTVCWSGDTIFYGCSAAYGGALFGGDSTVQLNGSTEFTSNSAKVSGGAVESYSSDRQALRALTISGPTTFANNTAAAAGGGFSVSGEVTVTFLSPGVLFVGNSAGVAGGAVFVSDISDGPSFSAVTFVSNFAGTGGGAFITGTGNDEISAAGITPTSATKFDGCQFVNNRATGTGGAIESVAGHDYITNTTFVGNTASVGGAMRLAGNAGVDNCSFVDNRSDEGEGPAIANVGVILVIKDSSFTGNVFFCEPGKYLDFTEAGDVFDVACKGCGGSCDGCTFQETLRVPICTQAMEHAISSGGATTLQTVSIERGFWRATSTSTDVLACFRAEACLGGITGSFGYCRNGYEGPYCSICSDGYAEGYGFACDTCPDRERVFVLAAVLAVFFLICAAAVASYTMSSPLESSGRGTIERLTRFIPLQSIKIVVVALQIVTQFTSIANVTFPHVYQRFLDIVNFINFDLVWISQLSGGCLFNFGIHGRLLIATIGPMIAAVFLGLTYVVAARRSRGSAEAMRVIRHRHVSMMLLLTFLVYSSVSSIIFQTFACDDLADGKKYLRVDYRVACNSPNHERFQIYAFFMMLLYAGGIPTVYAGLLVQNRAVLQDGLGREDSESTQSFSDLWKPYKPSVFYYEVIECGRRVLLTGAVVFIYPNTSAQIAVTLMIAVFFGMVSEGLAPFASRWDTWISRMGHVVVYVSMYVALLLKVDVSDERSGSQKVFEALLVAVNLGLILAVVVETGVIVCSMTETVRMYVSPRFRGTRVSVTRESLPVEEDESCCQQD